MNRSDGIEIGNLLTEISKREFEKGRPILSAIIVNKIDRIPSTGFFCFLKIILKMDSSMIQEPKFIKLLQKKCFDFWANDENYNKFKNDF